MTCQTFGRGNFLIILRDDPSESCSPEFSSVASFAVQILVCPLIDRGQVQLPGAGGALDAASVVTSASGGPDLLVLVDPGPAPGAPHPLLPLLVCDKVTESRRDVFSGGLLIKVSHCWPVQFSITLNCKLKLSLVFLKLTIMAVNSVSARSFCNITRI